MRNLTFFYIVGLSIIALVILTSQYLVQHAISTSLYDSKTINISGGQSMLSQKIAKTALALERAENEADFNKTKRILKNDITRWETFHHALQYGNEELGLDNVNNSEKTYLLFLDIEKHYVAIKQAVDQLLALNYDPIDSKARLSKEVNLIQDNEKKFIGLMNEITLDYDNESKQRVTDLSRTEYLLLAIALTLLLLEGFFIFKPAISRIKVYTKKLIRQEESLKIALKNQEKEKEKVDDLNRQAQSVFENVKQGVFLLNDKFQISEFYAKALENIFEKDELGGSNFLDLFNPRLLERDQMALDIFVKHLFNSEIEEEILDQLNPVSEVEIYQNDHGTEIKTRYISVSFSRILKGGQIISVLVTITDDTDAVLLKKKIRDAEERNKKESAQLLNILKVDPKELKNYLSNALTSIKGVSEKYEKEGSSDLRKLVDFTFREMHILKSNATLIGLDLLSDKFHQVENTIVRLKEKLDLRGNDFLAILYEINEINEILINMERMLGRISEVKNEFNHPKLTKTNNAAWIAQLESGSYKLSKELNKKINFKISRDEVRIPEYYESRIKDVMIQLIRNTLVHGLETAQERIKQGKTEHGNIWVSIKKKDETLVLSYKDDGAGLREEKILRKAILNGTISEKKAKSADFETILRLIFNNGFSTSDHVDHHAGRGQGMGLIRGIIKDLNGKFKVGSKTGKAFKIEFHLPLIPEPVINN